MSGGSSQLARRWRLVFRMSQEDGQQIAFSRDTTIRWSCREGDYVIWLRFRDPFGSEADDQSVIDVWELRDGDYVTITNRLADLPVWFELYPDEAGGVAAGQMMKKLETGWRPRERMEGPNLWRILCGDRVVWVGPTRGGNGSHQILAVVAMRANALAIAESNRPDYDPLQFGDVVQGHGSERTTALLHTAVSAARNLGPPREVSTGYWAIG